MTFSMEKKNPFKASQEAVFSLCAAAAAAAATASVVSVNDWVAFVKGWRIKQRDLMAASLVF